MSKKSFMLGNTLRITAKFTDVDGNLVDPTTVTFAVKDSAGIVTTTTSPSALIVRDYLGTYVYELVPTLSGAHVIRWSGSGDVVAAGETYFNITPSSI